MGENPPDGAVIDYALPDSVQGPVTLEILDKSGAVVRKYASSDSPYATHEELAKQLIPLYWLKMPATLPATPGMHRWVWDMRWATPTAPHYEYPISAVPHATPRVPQGPLALPGDYTVRLTANGKSVTVPLTVKIDPRVPATTADLASLFQLESHLAGMVSSGAQADLEAHSAREQIGALSKGAPAEVKEALETADKQLESLLEGKESASGGEQEPGLDDVAGEVQSLYGEVGQVDAAPTVVQQDASRHTAEELKEVLEKWNRVKGTEIPALNQKLSAAHLPPINMERKPDSMPEGGDED
jgi:hypothetical protein